jgi:hypothetical protein
MRRASVETEVGVWGRESQAIHTLNLAAVGAFALWMVSYVIVIYGALMSSHGKHVIRPRIDALIKGAES